MQDYIYLVIIQTGTRPARFFKFITRKPYNHVSLAADINLTEMYSFCRTYRRIPFPATFNKEIVGQGTLEILFDLNKKSGENSVKKKKTAKKRGRRRH